MNVATASSITDGITRVPSGEKSGVASKGSGCIWISGVLRSKSMLPSERSSLTDKSPTIDEVWDSACLPPRVSVPRSKSRASPTSPETMLSTEEADSVFTGAPTSGNPRSKSRLSTSSASALSITSGSGISIAGSPLDCSGSTKVSMSNRVSADRTSGGEAASANFAREPGIAIVALASVCGETIIVASASKVDAATRAPE